MPHRFVQTWLWPTLAIGLHLLAGPASAQNFYEGRQINMIVGSGVGGGYDTYARLVARHWPKHIPGNPAIVVQNMPAAGSLVAANTLANTSPRDGTTIAQLQNHIGVEPLMGLTGSLDNVKYDAFTLNWLGSAAKEYPLVVAWHTSPITSLKEAMAREMIVGSSGTATADSVYARVLNALAGTKFKVIDGYKDNPQMILAIESGEIAGRVGWFLSSLMSTQGDAVKQGKLKILAQVALDKHPDLPQIPLASEFITDPVKAAQFSFAVSWLQMGRPFAAPPGVPADRVKLLRDSFMATLADPALLEEARKMSVEISPMTGAEIQALLTRQHATPREIVQSVRSVFLGK